MTTSNENGKTRRLMTSEQRAIAADDNRTQHIRLTFSMHRLEHSLGQAAPGREEKWLGDVVKALELLVVAMNESQDIVCRDDGLIEEIKHTTPRLLSRIANLRDEFDGLLQQATTLREQLKQAVSRSNTAFTDLRQRMDWLLSGLKHHQAKETDLIYEAINVDIGVGD